MPTIYPRLGYIYLITNTVNGKCYVGQTVQSKPTERFRQHLKDADNGKTKILSSAIRKYGKETFTFEVIFVVFDPKDLGEMERHFIREYDSCVLDGTGEGYNVDRGGAGISSDLAKKIANERVRNGSNPFAGELGSMLSSKVTRERIESGTHHFVGAGEWARERENKKLAAGTHHFTTEEGKKRSYDLAMDRLNNGTSIFKRSMQCPNCGKVGVGPVMKRHHFDNCKKITQPSPDVCRLHGGTSV